MPLKILLIDPPHKIFGALRMWMPSPGLLGLAAYLEAHGRPVAVVDATTLKRPWDDLTRRLAQGAWDVVGVTCSAATFHYDALYTVRLARQVLPEAVTVAGGAHFTLNADRMLEALPELDYIVSGEGEQTFLELIDRLEQGCPDDCDRISGVVTRSRDGSDVPAPRPLVDDLDRLPFPAYDKVDLNHPVYHLHGMGRRAVGISTSRGCGDRCAYCSESVFWDACWRGRSGPLVVEEMQRLERDYGKTLFVFNENSFNQSRSRNTAFIEALGASGGTYDWWFQSRVKDILRDRDLLDDYKRLGCYEVMLGIESILPETLKSYTKSQTLEQAREAAGLLRSRGIMVMTNVMFGDLHDTEQTLARVYDFVRRIGDFLVLCLTTPLPGTRYHAQALREGRIEVHDLSRYDFMHPVMTHPLYSRKELLAIQKKYLQKYYTRPTVLFKMLFSPNPFVRMSYRLIMRYAWYEARNRTWVQENYQEVPAQLVTGKTSPTGQGPRP